MSISKGQIIALVSVLVLCVFGMSSCYTVEEGHVGIVKRFSEAKEQTSPGLHAKVPFVDTVEEIEIRTRKNVEQMPSSSKEQMPLTAEVSLNWTVHRDSALDLYKKYGGLDQFESRILDPRFRAATKDVLPHYTAEQLIQDRSRAVTEIEAALTKDLDGYPVKIDSVQIENIILPAQYLISIQTKQTEKNLADAEQHKLARQKLEAQRDVNTAEASRDSAKAIADGEAYKIKAEAEAQAESIRMKGLAEADAIRAKAEALKNNPLIVELTKAQNWDGKLPQTVLGEGQSLLMNMNSKP
ncbi:prohibitin family protein [Simiduia litorea]